MNYEALRAQLIRHEGKLLEPYMDTTGHITIGVGHNLSANGISDAICSEMLDEDIAIAILECQKCLPWFMSKDEVRQRVLIDMMFNLGSASLLTFRETLQAMADGRNEDAANHMLASRWAKQVGHRAVELAEMWRTGVDPS